MDNRTRMERRSEARYMRAAWDRLEALLLEEGEKLGDLNAHDLLTRATAEIESLRGAIDRADDHLTTGHKTADSLRARAFLRQARPKPDDGQGFRSDLDDPPGYG